LESQVRTSPINNPEKMCSFHFTKQLLLQRAKHHITMSGQWRSNQTTECSAHSRENELLAAFGTPGECNIDPNQHSIFQDKDSSCFMVCYLQ
jgi:hypothetical protein